MNLIKTFLATSLIAASATAMAAAPNEPFERFILDTNTRVGFAPGMVGVTMADNQPYKVMKGPGFQNDILTTVFYSGGIAVVHDFGSVACGPATWLILDFVKNKTIKVPFDNCKGQLSFSGNTSDTKTTVTFMQKNKVIYQYSPR